MRVGFAGMTHLGQTMAAATEQRGFDVVRSQMEVGLHRGLPSCDLVFVTLDIDVPADLVLLKAMMRCTLACTLRTTPMVLMSQVPPGYTRLWHEKRPALWYQLDPLILSCALDRALNPERHVIGCADPSQPLPLAYQQWLSAFPAPVLRMSYESAELAKVAMNFALAAQVSVANTIDSIAEKIGADYADVERALRSDARIGEKAYMKPGVIGGHLPRDVRRIRELAAQHGTPAEFANAIGPMEGAP